MRVYLIRHGHTDELNQVTDPYSRGLTTKGRRQAHQVAGLCRDWRIELLCASTMLRSQQTADLIAQEIPSVQRWDLEGLEDLSIEDLNLDPTAGHLASTWTPEQRETALQSAWGRVTSFLARLVIYAEKNAIQRVAVVTNLNLINLMLLCWLGLDWGSGQQIHFPVTCGGTCCVELLGPGNTRIHWINRE